MDGEEPEVDRLLAEASSIVRRCKEAAGKTEPTTGYKGRQIEELKTFATLTGRWISLDTQKLIYLDKGGENEVFYDGKTSVLKLNNFDYAGDDLTNFFIRIFAHNYFFRNIPYRLVGFAYNSCGEFCAVLTQPYVHAEREAYPEEIITYMEMLGFIREYDDEFHNEYYEVFDVVPNNVLYGMDGMLYFIDTQIRLRK
ncbi:MAG: hypothetical protein LUD74_07485 [Tannerellaceae bacterium]|nr:hypothetical protein [Tannerellaceae bacterium]